MKIQSFIRTRLKDAYEKLTKEGGVVEISTPYTFSDQEKKELEKKLGLGQAVRYEYTVDESIMAGFIVRYGSKMIDLSLRSELQNLKHIMYENL